MVALFNSILSTVPFSVIFSSAFDLTFRNERRAQKKSIIIIIIIKQLYSVRRRLIKHNLGFSHVFSANLSYISSNILNRKFLIMYIGQISGLKQPKTLTQNN